MADQPFWNPSDKDSGCTLSNSDRTASQAALNAGLVRSTNSLSSGKWYVEATFDSGSSYFGIATSGHVTSSQPGFQSTGWSVIKFNGSKFTNNSATGYGSGFSDGDIVMMAVDLDNEKIWWGKNGTWFNSGDPAAGTNEAFSSLTGTYFLAFGSPSSSGAKNLTLKTIASYSYSPPSGFTSGWGGSAGILGDAALTEAGDSVTSAGALRLQGTAALTESADSVSSAGTVTIKGTASLTEAGDSTSATGTLAIKGASAQTEADDSVSAVIRYVAVGTAAITEADDSVSATATLAIAGAASITEADDATTATGNLPIVGQNALAEADDSVTAEGALLIQGASALTEADDSVSATGALYIAGLADLIESDDSVDANDFVPRGHADLIEDEDFIATTGRVPLEWLDALATRHDVPNRTLCAVCARPVLPETMHRQVRRVGQRLVWTGLYTCQTCIDIPGDPPPIHRRADPRPVPNARPSRS